MGPSIAFLGLRNSFYVKVLRKNDLMLSSCTSDNGRTSGGIAMATGSGGIHWPRDDEPALPLAGRGSSVDDAWVITFCRSE